MAWNGFTVLIQQHNLQEERSSKFSNTITNNIKCKEAESNPSERPQMPTTIKIVSLICHGRKTIKKNLSLPPKGATE